MKPTHGRHATAIGSLLAALLATYPGALDADNRTAASEATRAPSRAEAPAERKVRSRADGGPSRPSGAHTRGQIVHVVRAGDSVGRIAAQYRVTPKSLIDANKLARPNQLRIGQRLVVPGARVAGNANPAQIDGASVDSGHVLSVRAGPRRVPTRVSLDAPELEGRPFDLAWPVAGQVISPFGRRRNGWHAGMDVRAEIGTPILAAAPGVVISSGQERAYGRIIRIEHDHGFVTVYAHNLENLVDVGDRVAGGTIIATVGRSGRTTAPHLHFEIRRDGIVYNPLRLLPPREVIEMHEDVASNLSTDVVRERLVDVDLDE